VTNFHTTCYSVGCDSAPEGGDVLFGVEKQQLERLYQQHLADDNYLQMVCSAFLILLFVSSVFVIIYCNWCEYGLSSGLGSIHSDDGDGWDRAPEGGDVLLGVEKQQLERLYQQHPAEEHYLQQVG
jgi:S-adenosylmethionine:diacylglycerol 3-amino-3-carboxypropyl transferase